MNTIQKNNQVADNLLKTKIELTNTLGILIDLQDFSTIHLVEDAIKKINEAVGIYLAK